MRKISVYLILIVFATSCHKGTQYPNTQTQFEEDLSFRLGKWYSVSDTIGDAKLGINTLFDTVWFINDTLAGWTGFVPYQPHAYAFLKTYISPQSIYNIVYIIPDPVIPNKIDTEIHQFGFTPIGDTLTIYWDFTRQPPLTEQYVKMK